MYKVCRMGVDLCCICIIQSADLVEDTYNATDLSDHK